jgi:hypothetical protein
MTRQEITVYECSEAFDPPQSDILENGFKKTEVLEKVVMMLSRFDNMSHHKQAPSVKDAEVQKLTHCYFN